MFSFISSIKVDATFDKNRGLNNKQIRPGARAKLIQWNNKSKWIKYRDYFYPDLKVGL